MSRYQAFATRLLSEKRILNIGQKVMNNMTPPALLPKTPNTQTHTHMTLKELQKTHFIPAKYLKYFKSDKPKSDLESTSKPKSDRTLKRQKPLKQQKTADVIKDGKKLQKTRETLLQVLENQFHQDLQLEKWSIQGLVLAGKNQERCLVFYTVADHVNDYAIVQELMNHFRPAVQKAFNMRMLNHKTSAPSKFVPRIEFKHQDPSLALQTLDFLEAAQYDNKQQQL